MNGVHDLGGKHGFGPIEVEENEPIFHDEWEKRVFGMFFTIAPHQIFNLDELRHAIERMGPKYLQTSYYEHWLHAYETLLIEKGTITAEEYEARCRQVAEEMDQ